MTGKNNAKKQIKTVAALYKITSTDCLPSFKNKYIIPKKINIHIVIYMAINLK